MAEVAPKINNTIQVASKNYINKMIENIMYLKEYKKNNDKNVNIYKTNTENNKGENKNFIPKNSSFIGNKVFQKKKLLNSTRFAQNINLDNIETITYSSYFESNIPKLLSYLNQFNINNIKIVSHSSLMKQFLNEEIIGDKRRIPLDIKTVEKNENMWSIIFNQYLYTKDVEQKSEKDPKNIQSGYLMSNEVSDLNSKKIIQQQIFREICITRSAFTTVNLYDNKKDKINQFIDKDTMLSLYGILAALDFNNPSINLNNPSINLNDCNNTVFVSVLVRTWITALCLYLPKIQINSNMKFTLVVSPFIKEATTYIGIKRNTDDNLPIPINKQIIIIKNFLKFLRETISSISSSSPLPQYIQSSNIIRDFFDSNGILEIYGVKELKDKKFKYVKYEISYDSVKNFYVSTNKKENYFGTIVQLKKVEEQSTRTCGIFGCKKNSEKLQMAELYILPGVRKPTTKLKILTEPLSKNEVKKFKNYTSDIKIGIIDIDEEGQKFTKEQILKFYNSNKELFTNSNILVVCTQNSLSIGTTQHFQHLLKEVLKEQTNTNFNFKNNNKKNTTQVIPLKSFSAFSGSKTGLRTRVYTQGLDNDRLKVEFHSVDFSYTSSNEGGILCIIKYDGKDVINIMNSYQKIKHNLNIGLKRSSSNIHELKSDILKKTLFCGNIPHNQWGAMIFNEHFTNTYKPPVVNYSIKENSSLGLKNTSKQVKNYLNNSRRSLNFNVNPQKLTSSNTVAKASTFLNTTVYDNPQSGRESISSTFSNNLVFDNAQSGRESISSISSNSSNNLFFSNARNNL